MSVNPCAVTLRHPPADAAATAALVLDSTRGLAEADPFLAARGKVYKPGRLDGPMSYETRQILENDGYRALLGQ